MGTLPGVVHIAVVVKVVNKIDALKHYNLKIARTAYVALNDTPRTSRGWSNDLGTLPGVVHIAVVVKVVNKIGVLKYYNLKIARTAYVALNDTPRTSRGWSNDLGTLPGVIHIAVVMKVVNKIGALKYYNLKIARAAYIALNDTPRTSRWLE